MEKGGERRRTGSGEATPGYGFEATGDLRDTIVARATPPGRGAIAVLRVSGPGTRDLLRTLGAGRTLEAPPRTAVLAPLRPPGEPGVLLDRGLVTFFPAPASYTGEDMAELGLHGGPMVVAQVLEACLHAGARSAEPGEFTRRAWLEGKMDRLQVEAIQELIEAESPARHAVAILQAEGGLTRRIEELRRGLLQVEALLAHHLDFPDEDQPPTPVSGVITALEPLKAAMTRLLATAPGGGLLRSGAVVVLAGRPNAGKSSLFNALVGEERVLVSAEPGTTRDAVDAAVAFQGFPFRLVDTAGLRASAGGVEAAGIEVAHRWIRGAQLVLWCRRASEGPATDAEREEVEALVHRAGGVGEVGASGAGASRVGEPPGLVRVWTCVDEEGPPSVVQRGGSVEGDGGIGVSARTGEGLDRLQAALVRATFGSLPPEELQEGGVLVRERHRRLVAAALRETEAFGRALGEGVPADIACLHLRDAEDALVELVGPVEGEAVLDTLFRSFCIGK